MSLITELQRRKVFKVATAYLVVGWLTVQIATSVFPAMDMPAWTVKLVVMLALLGFPVALVLAWAFDVTPEGIRAAPATAGNKSFYLTVGVLSAVAIGWYLRAGPGDGEANITERSIAVLPFVNMSGDAENEYFSDGISEEILNSLAQVADLKVAARTSSFSFKGKDAEVPDIARALEVRMVLEGSVRKQGDRVRITAQLIDASNGYHVWSQTYDRQLRDIFVIQAEIAEAIARELKVKLSDGRAAVAEHATDPETYALYLKGLSLWQQRGEANLEVADQAFRDALARDPGYAKAWAGLALVQLVLPEYQWVKISTEGPYQIARDAAERALALDPNLPEAWAVLAALASADARFGAADALFQRAIEIAPSYATAHQWLAESLLQRGSFQEALVASDKALALDPVSAVVALVHAQAVGAAGDMPAAIAELRELHRAHPEFANGGLTLQVYSLRAGDDAAFREALEIEARDRTPETLKLIDALVAALHDPRVAAATVPRVTAMLAGREPARIRMGWPQAAKWFQRVGRPDLALAEIEKLARALPVTGRLVVMGQAFDELRCEPRFRALVRELKVDDSARAACASGAEGGAE